MSDNMRHSPIFFGVYDENGRIIKPGLLLEMLLEKLRVHPRAKK